MDTDGARGFTFQEVIDDLLAPAGLEGAVERWGRKRRDPAIIAFVTEFDHTVLPRTTPQDVRGVLGRSSHALGWLRKERDTEGFIARANPPWAMAYLFHACLERHMGRVPTWGEFFAFVTGQAAAFWWNPVHRSAQRRGIDPVLGYRAALWRLATAWQSAIRTVYTIATLRHDHGVDVRYHLFTHVELRIDGWHGPHAFRLVMPSEYESTKVDPREIFGGTGVTVHDLVVSRQSAGQVWLPTSTDLADLADALQADHRPPAMEVFA